MCNPELTISVEKRCRGFTPSRYRGADNDEIAETRDDFPPVPRHKEMLDSIKR
jgi:hypothetical protein